MSETIKRTPEQDLAKVESIALQIMEQCLDCPVHDVDATFTPLEAIIRRRLKEIEQYQAKILSLQNDYDKLYIEVTKLRGNTLGK